MGHVVNYDSAHETYSVLYQDNDSEDLYHHEIKKLLSPTKNKNIVRFSPSVEPNTHFRLPPDPDSYFDIDIDTHQLQRSQNQYFYLLNSASFSTNYNSVYILGYTGNEYVITISNQIYCSCPDTNPGCKHVLFLLELLGEIIESPNIKLSLKPSLLYQRLLSLSTTGSIRKFTLDSLANELCTSYHTSSCSYCSSPLSGSLLICSRCGSANHIKCVRNLAQPPKSCPCCDRPYMPFHSPFFEGYRNFNNILKSFRYPVQSFTLPAKRPMSSSSSQHNILSNVPRAKLPATTPAVFRPSNIKSTSVLRPSNIKSLDTDISVNVKGSSSKSLLKMDVWIR